jgi:hypothetical protein
LILLALYWLWNMLFLCPKTIFYSLYLLGVISSPLLSKDIAKDTTVTKEVIISAARVPSVYSESARKIEVINKNQISEKPIQTISDILKLN